LQESRDGCGGGSCRHIVYSTMLGILMAILLSPLYLFLLSGYSHTILKLIQVLENTSFSKSKSGNMSYFY
jgi:hypothetical protein